MYNKGWDVMGKRWSERAKALSLTGGSQWITPTTGKKKKKIKEQIININGSKRFESEETVGQT